MKKIRGESRVEWFRRQKNHSGSALCSEKTFLERSEERERLNIQGRKLFKEGEAGN